MNDFLVVGQGIAGTVLTYVLRQRGASVHVIDDGHSTSSSLVAAGMWNPVSFRNLHRTWRSEELLPVARRVYLGLNDTLGIQCYHPLELARLFPDSASARAWDERSDLPAFKGVLTGTQDDVVRSSFIQPHGHGVVHGSGWVDLPLLLEAMKHQLKEAEALTETRFDPDLLEVADDHVRYAGRTARHAIFCTGSRHSDIPWFSAIPVRPNKGQVLSLQIEALPLERVVHFGHFLLPTGGGHFRLGATYEYQPEDGDPSEAGRAALLNSLAAVVKREVRVTDHRAAFRPTVPDRKPLLGKHPELPSLVLFNGLGSKGVLLAPWCAERLADLLLENVPLPAEIDLLRYWKR